MNPKTRLRSAAMRYFSSVSYQEKARNKARRRRNKLGELPTVHYFHQVDDPYSHLAVQKLDQLKAKYDMPFHAHLVAKPDNAYQGSSDHFAHWARVDAESVARDYGAGFAPSIDMPGPDAVARANQALADHLDQDDFARVALSIGQALWAQTPIDPSGDPLGGARAVDEGNTLRRALGHYQGAMFYFDGEWYWGLDRVRLLEARLTKEGFGNGSSTLCVAEPTPKDTNSLDTDGILLEYFPSLRSPYTAIGHQRVLDLIAKSGVSVHVRPVMPMLMRGIPAPREKQRYIIADAGREGRARGVPFGRIVDPFGEPVRRAFALFAGAAELNRGMDFVTAYLRAAWFDGIDITQTRGLKHVADRAGLDWAALLETTQSTRWEAILAENLNILLEQNLWGVPSFRVSGGNSERAYACWGQDRIWRVQNEIANRV